MAVTVSTVVLMAMVVARALPLGAAPPARSTGSSGISGSSGGMATAASGPVRPASIPPSGLPPVLAAAPPGGERPWTSGRTTSP